MENIAEEDRSTKRTVKVLGINWDSKKDQLRLPCDWEVRRQCQTKRDILRAIASIYDPLGLFQPCTLIAKCFLRKLWLNKLSWDDKIGGDLQEEWKQIHLSILPIFRISLPRYIGNGPPHRNPDATTLVVFSDASREAYATAVYLRTSTMDSTKYTTNLIYAKSRLSPKSADTSVEISIPKLELLGIVIATTAAKFVRDSLNMPTLVRTLILSDSTIALSWIRSKKPLPVFISNRVKKIKQLDNAEFHHVSGPENPADLLTRGVTGLEMERCEFWWTGPKWLQLEPNKWPTNANIDPISSEELDRVELTANNPVYHSFFVGEVLTESYYPLKIDPTTYSSFRRLVRVTAMCIKFIKRKLWQNLDEEVRESFPTLDRLMETATTGSVITSQELRKSKLFWIKTTQLQELENVFKSVESGKPSSLTKQLNIYIDDEGLLRCFGRFGYSDLSFEAIRPLLLPKNCHVTNIIIRDAHERLFHAGISHTLSQIRREFWVPHGRNAIRKVLNRCVTCRKLKGAPYALPGMPPWPRERISRSTPFQYTGVDYLGPVNVSVLGTTLKMWVSLFTCLSTRAIHLEYEEECTATSFIDCLSRFISRRGAPEQMVSDNAPQFRLAKKLMDRTWTAVLQGQNVLTYVAEKGIKWKFTTALVPWQGGFYERLVGIVKSTFKCVVGRRLFKREEFTTVITEIEAIINSRPLTYVCSDSKSGLALRPMDFLIDQSTGTPDVEDMIRPEGGDGSRILLGHWKSTQRRLNMLWRQFYDDYLLSLRERFQTKHRNKRCDVHASPKLNEVVLVKNSDNTPRGTWKLGKITRIIPSRDGEIRSVELLLPNQMKIERSVSHLYPLEIQTHVNSANAPDKAGDDSEAFEGFEGTDSADAQHHLQFLEAGLDITALSASIHGNVRASLSTTAAPLRTNSNSKRKATEGN